jgi:hypothetical protein
MSPKEKAFQLINRYLDINEEQEYNTPRYLTKEEAVEGSLITVDEILKVVNDIWMESFSTGESDNKFYNYWQEVKTEINKL